MMKHDFFRNASKNHAETAEWMTRLTDIYEGFQEVQIFLLRVSS